MDATTGSRKGIAPAVAFLVSDNASFKSNASSANYSKEVISRVGSYFWLARALTL